MKLQTLFGCLIGVAIAFMIGNILIDRLDQSYSRATYPTVFIVLFTGVCGVVGGAIASPVRDPNQFSNSQIEDKNPRH